MFFLDDLCLCLSDRRDFQHVLTYTTYLAVCKGRDDLLTFRSRAETKLAPAIRFLACINMLRIILWYYLVRSWPVLATQHTVVVSQNLLNEFFRR